MPVVGTVGRPSRLSPSFIARSVNPHVCENQGEGLGTLVAMNRSGDASSSPDWIINLNQPARAARSDPRLHDVRIAIAAMQTHLAAVEASAKQVEALLRACAERGMTNDEIAVQAALPIEVVARVLSGDPLLKWRSS